MSTATFECFHLDSAVNSICESLRGQQVAVQSGQVHTTIELLDAGNTLPFIARYRKEATGNLDEVALRFIEDAIGKLRDLAQRKNTILRSIQEQGTLSDELRLAIEQCEDKSRLEDLYLPFKPKRRTRATVAREQGLQPLADLLLRQESLRRSRGDVLQPYVSAEKGVADQEAALQGALDIVAEAWSEDADARQWLTEQAKQGQITSKVKRGKKQDGSKFEMYFDHSEALAKIPSHRFLAMKRGEAEGLLSLGVVLDDEYVLRRLNDRWLTNPRFEFLPELRRTVEDCYQRLLKPSVESALLQTLKDRSDEEAIAVFAKNLRELLLAAPAGPHVTMGLDPGFRTGCKVAVVDGTGKFLANATIYPTPPKNDVAGAQATLKQLIEKYKVRLIAIGNGTASRETDAFVTQLLQAESLDVTKVIVNESGASIYSASKLAAEEYPDLDVTVRGAISIAHRLQDPLSELVKIDAKSIGVGQYQHDVNQSLLRKSLDREVESCVNLVGVDLNLASGPLLSYVAGIGPKLAANIVQFRNENGRFTNRKQLAKVPKLGKKALQQAAGFLRIRDGDQPLDNSAVHPETYYLVDKMAQSMQVPAKGLLGNDTLINKLVADQYVDDQFGLPTIKDILAELKKPGRDSAQPVSRRQVRRGRS